MEKEHVYEQTYKDYLSRIAELDFSFIADTLGIKLDGDEAVVPFFGKRYRVSKKAITDPDGKQPHLSICVILCKYLLMCPLIEPLGGNWMAFKDFKDAAPLVNAFSNTVAGPMAETFSGRVPELEKCGKKMGGYPPGEEFPYDLCMQFDALPKVPLLLLFNDMDDEFPAQCGVLFEKRTEKFIDMECLAMVAMLFFEYLKKESSR
ncbi:MAG: DUF3786 domain-containing protein [Desulfobacterales bacterium]|nr:DUF3786 domain-containing protein [Desulfobacterales bacterium]